MKKRTYALVALISLVVSGVYNFNAVTVSEFIAYLLIAGLALFVALVSIIKAIQNIRKREFKKTIPFVAVCFTVLFLFYGGFILLRNNNLCFDAITPPQFRTNIIIKQCNFGGYSGCYVSDPWYYKSGCDVSMEKKVEVLKYACLPDTAPYVTFDIKMVRYVYKAVCEGSDQEMIEFIERR